MYESQPVANHVPSIRCVNANNMSSTAEYIYCTDSINSYNICYKHEILERVDYSNFIFCIYTFKEGISPNFDCQVLFAINVYSTNNPVCKFDIIIDIIIIIIVIIVIINSNIIIVCCIVVTIIY